MRAWLLVTADRTASNLLRARRRDAALVQRLARSRDSTRTAEAADGASDRLPAELVAALDRLRRADREVVALALVAELSYEEIAGALGVPVGTVRSRLSRARSWLRSLMIPRTEHPPTTERTTR